VVVMSGVEFFNPNTATRTCVVWEDGIPVICKTQEVTALLAANMQLQADFDRAAVARNPAGLRHVARIPMVVWEQLRAAGIVDGMTVVDEKRYLQFLSDRDAYRLRVDDGRRLA
jgi:hypothetical protein